jgi:TetR/AcrR family transcriptional repressor of lmrAB and yxaGH operons
MSNDTRTRMIESTVRELERKGVCGMSFTDVLASSGAARGRSTTTFPEEKCSWLPKQPR